MKRHLIFLFLLASCQGGESNDSANLTGEASEDAPGSSAPAAGTAGAPPRTAGLTGLYESGSGRSRNQLCIIQRGGGEARFGLVVWGSNMHSCSGSGSVERNGNRLRFSMAGDSSCTLEAAVEGGRVTLPSSIPEGCSYYCGAQARLAGASFNRTGSTASDAMKARDLVGDSLCAGEG